MTDQNYSIEIIPADQPSALIAAEPLRLSQNPVVVYIRSLSEKTQRVNLRDLDVIAALIMGIELPTERRRRSKDEQENIESYLCVQFGRGWSQLRFEHTAAIRAQLLDYVSPSTGKPLAPATINRMIAAMRGVLKQAWKLGQMGVEDYHRAVDIKPAKGDTLPAGRDISNGELTALFTACYTDPTMADAAILAVAYMGLRRAEIAALDLADFDPDGLWLTVQHGKGNKQRKVATGDGAAAINDWITLRGKTPGALFLPIGKNGKITAERNGAPARITDQAIYNILEKRRKQANVAPFTPHDMRRTYAGDMLDAGADIVTVQHSMGHASPDTTARYDRRGDKAKQKAAALIHTPYKPRSRQLPIEGIN